MRIPREWRSKRMSLGGAMRTSTGDQRNEEMLIALALQFPLALHAVAVDQFMHVTSLRWSSLSKIAETPSS